MTYECLSTPRIICQAACGVIKQHAIADALLLSATTKMPVWVDHNGNLYFVDFQAVVEVIADGKMPGPAAPAPSLT